MYEFKRGYEWYNYVFEKTLQPDETIVVRMPGVSPNKRSVNEIGWQTDGDVKLYGTLSSDPEGNSAMWQEIIAGNAINKAVSAFKIANGGTEAQIAIRAIFV